MSEHDRPEQSKGGPLPHVVSHLVRRDEVAVMIREATLNARTQAREELGELVRNELLTYLRIICIDIAALSAKLKIEGKTDAEVSAAATAHIMEIILDPKRPF